MKFGDLVEPGKQQLQVWLDLSTFCNAACPQCHRTDPNGLDKVGWLPLVKWSLEDFKRQFPPGSINEVSFFEICGTWGDPMMSKDIGKITKYIIDNSNAVVHINTNGGIRTPEFYEDLGNYCGERLVIYFCVDGINNEMHQKYRRGIDLDLVLENMEALSSTKAIARGFTVIFKHNQDYIKDIENLCKMYGAQTVHIIKSDRFIRQNTFEFINEEGNKEVLEEVTKDINHLIKNPWIDTAAKNIINRPNLPKEYQKKLDDQKDKVNTYVR